MAFEQSVCWWCYEGAGIAPLDLIQTAKAIGYTGLELVPEDQFALVRDQGLEKSRRTACMRRWSRASAT